MLVPDQVNSSSEVRFNDSQKEKFALVKVGRQINDNSNRYNLCVRCDYIIPTA